LYFLNLLIRSFPRPKYKVAEEKLGQTSPMKPQAVVMDALQPVDVIYASISGRITVDRQFLSGFGGNS